MSVFQRLLKIASLQDELETVTMGIRECLVDFSAACFCLSPQHQRVRSKIYSSLEAVMTKQAHANQDLLEALAPDSEHSHDAVLLQAVHAMMQRLQLTPVQLEAEARIAMSSGGIGYTEHEQQVWPQPQPPLGCMLQLTSSSS